MLSEASDIARGLTVMPDSAPGMTVRALMALPARTEQAPLMAGRLFPEDTCGT